MRSFFAALRSLVLPYGTTSGTRIVLDGVNGIIRIYNSTNDQVGLITPLLDAGSPGPEMSVRTPSGASAGIFADHTFALMFLIPNDTVGETWAEGQLLANVFGGQPYVEVNSPNGTSGVASRIQLYGASSGAPADSRIRLDAATSVKVVGGARFYVSEHLPPLEVGYASDPLDSAGVTNAAETVVETVTAPLVTGYGYDVEWDSQFASTAAGDTAQLQLRQDTVAGTVMRRSRLTLPRVTDPWPCRLAARYTAAATGNKTFVGTLIRAAGTGTLTRVGTLANGGPSRLTVREVA